MLNYAREQLVIGVGVEGAQIADELSVDRVGIGIEQRLVKCSC
jgi:hypothetical protein